MLNDIYRMDYLLLYPHIRTTIGYRGTLLFDYVTDSMLRLSKLQSEILNNIDLSIKRLKTIYTTEEVHDFIGIIESNGFGSLGKVRYPEVKNQPKHFHRIEICEIKIAKNNLTESIKYIEKVTNHGCTTFVLIYDCIGDFEISINILDELPMSVNIKFIKELDLTKLKDMRKVLDHEKIYFVHVENNRPNDLTEYSNKIIWYSDTKKIVPFIEVFERSRYGHPYFFGRIYIDSFGNYSHGFNSISSIGNFDSDSIEEAINKLISKGSWLISRDTIIQCRMCEFRNICLDNSELNKEDKDLYSLIETCSYEPNI